MNKKTLTRKGLGLLISTSFIVGVAPSYALADTPAVSSPPARDTTGTDVAPIVVEGVRAKTGGVIDRKDQVKSDLTPGEYYYEAHSNGLSVGESRGGVSVYADDFYSAEKQDNNRLAFHTNIGFSGSKQRTVRSWFFSVVSLSLINDMGGDNKYPPNGEIESLDPGKWTNIDTSKYFNHDTSADMSTFQATEKAEEKLVHKRTGKQTHLDINSIMAGDKVQRFAQATSKDPIRYAWVVRYSPYDKKNKSFLNESLIFDISFNPWPSENNNFTEISAHIDDVHQLVVEPGKEIRIGKVNADKDSLPRILVEATSDQGKLVSTSSTEFSGAKGDSPIRIDDEGNIFWTMPSFIDNDLSTLKNIKFTTYAMPRTTDQLESAYQESVHTSTNINGNSLDRWYESDDPRGHYVGDESNIFPRYKQPNVIMEKSIDLDDTNFHNPGYTTTSNIFVSGVSATGEVTSAPQSYTFTATGFDKLMDTKENGGFLANVTLDTRGMSSGWTATMDDNHNVTVTTPENAIPGTYSNPKVVVTYTNGSKDVISLIALVKPNNTQDTTLAVDKGAQGKPGHTMTVPTKVASQYPGHDPIQPAHYAIKPDSVPAGWTVTVDDKGVVSATPGRDIIPGTVINPVVVATYPDNTTDEVAVSFSVHIDTVTPQYTAISQVSGQKATILPQVNTPHRRPACTQQIHISTR